MRTARLCLLAILLGSAGLSAVTLVTLDDAFAQSDAGVDAPTKPSDSLANPATDPLESVSDLKAAKKHGWPAAVFAAVVMLALAVGTAGKKINRLAWLGRGRWAVIVGGVTAVGAAGFDALLAGGSWLAVVTAVALTGAAYWQSSQTNDEVK